MLLLCLELVICCCMMLSLFVLCGVFAWFHGFVGFDCKVVLCVARGYDGLVALVLMVGLTCWVLLVLCLFVLYCGGL